LESRIWTVSNVISRGDIYFVSLDPTRGREQAGRRPALVVSVNAINRQPLVVTVVVGTDATNLPHDYPTNVRVTAAESGLPMDTVFLCFQIRSLDPSRFVDPRVGSPVQAGAVPAERMMDIDRALRMVLGL
jgi:mRNA interferase MazF